ncbi:glycosyl hydrolase 108 family protein, partial [Roseomonas sp. CECT 9278]|uniref:glycosyl hydrolase 108 family protein n=1 Tax=Roseomonas sp. CECT 9278 TaxID=2845823 RepID=UPI001E2CDC65
MAFSSSDRFAACSATVMAARGGFTPHDALVDGPAAHGIGLGLLSVWVGGPADARDLRALGRDGAARILRAMVWSPLGAARLAPGPDLVLFAYAVEAGTMQALVDLQAHLGVEESGAPDAATLDAARAQDPAMLAAAIAAAHGAWRRARGLPPAGS